MYTSLLLNMNALLLPLPNTVQSTTPLEYALETPIHTSSEVMFC